MNKEWTWPKWKENILGSRQCQQKEGRDVSNDIHSLLNVFHVSENKECLILRLEWSSGGRQPSDDSLLWLIIYDKNQEHLCFKIPLCFSLWLWKECMTYRAKRIFPPRNYRVINIKFHLSIMPQDYINYANNPILFWCLKKVTYLTFIEIRSFFSFFLWYQELNLRIRTC